MQLPQRRPRRQNIRRRETGSEDGFRHVESVPLALASKAPDGRSRLYHLLTPDYPTDQNRAVEDTRPMMALLSPLIGQGGWLMKLQNSLGRNSESGCLPLVSRGDAGRSCHGLDASRRGSWTDGAHGGDRDPGAGDRRRFRGSGHSFAMALASGDGAQRLWHLHRPVEPEFSGRVSWSDALDA